MRSVAVEGRRAVIIDELVPTELGSDLLDALGLHVETFELMNVVIDQGCIAQTLHQLDS